MTESQLSHHQYQEIEDLFDKWKEDEEDTISVTDEIYHTAEDSELDERQIKSPTDEKEMNRSVDTNHLIVNDVKLLDHKKKSDGVEQSLHLEDGNNECKDDNVLLVNLSKPSFNEKQNDGDNLHRNDQPIKNIETDQLANDLRYIINRSFADISSAKEWIKQYKQQHSFSGSSLKAEKFCHKQDFTEKERPESIITDLCEKFNENDLS